MRPRAYPVGLVAAILAGLVGSVVLTWYLGTGARAEDVCTDAFFVPGGEWSWRHLGVRCEYGEPAQTGYAHPWPYYLAIVFAIFAAAAVLGEIAVRVSSRKR